MSDYNERACHKCGSLLHHEENCQVGDTVAGLQEFKDCFRALQFDIHRNNISKGWWEEREALMRLVQGGSLEDFTRKMIISNLICLTHSELSEGLEGLRKDLPDDKCPEFPMVVVEMADAIIRIMDLAEGFGWPLAEAIVAKVEMNKGRAYKHGGKAF